MPADPIQAILTSVTARVLARVPSDLTPAWAARVLAAHAPGTTVSGVEQTRVEVGTTTRVWLCVDHDGPAELPRRWFVKLPSGLWKARAITALARLPQTEVRFYNEIADRLTVTRPPALAAASRLGRGFTLVIGDVTEHGAVAGRSGDARSSWPRPRRWSICWPAFTLPSGSTPISMKSFPGWAVRSDGWKTGWVRRWPYP